MRWVRVMVSWLRRDRPMPPPPIDPRRLQAARDAAHQATNQLRNARAQDEDVSARAAHADRILRANNLGPAFWRALGNHRG